MIWNKNPRLCLLFVTMKQYKLIDFYLISDFHEHHLISWLYWNTEKFQSINKYIFSNNSIVSYLYSFKNTWYISKYTREHGTCWTQIKYCEVHVYRFFLITKMSRTSIWSKLCQVELNYNFICFSCSKNDNFVLQHRLLIWSNVHDQTCETKVWLLLSKGRLQNSFKYQVALDIHAWIIFMVVGNNQKFWFFSKRQNLEQVT